MQHQPCLILVRVCKNYEGLVSLSGDMVIGEEVENNLTLQPYLGEGLYEGLVSLPGDVVPGEEVENNLTLLPYLGEGLYKSLVRLAVTGSPGKKLRTNSSQSYPGECLYEGLVSLRGNIRS